MAIDGELIKTDVLVQQMQRMLKDSRSSALASECFGQWLGFHRFESFNAISTEKYPEFTPALRKAMYLEAQRFCEDVVSNNGSVWDILDADHTFLNEDLARHYGIPWTGGSGFKRVEGIRQYQRGGIAGMAFFLTQSSAPLRPSPIKRGKFMYSTLLGRHLPPPPEEVAPLPADEGDRRQSIRQMLENHRTNRACASCHVRFDHLGLALQGFDTIGRQRDKDAHGRAIDSKFALPSGEIANGMEGVRRYLETEKSLFARQLCRKLVGYALGRSVLLTDQPLLDEMQRSMEKDRDKFSYLVALIVTSKQFRYRRGSNSTLEFKQ